MEEREMIRKHIFVSGRVQGVGFRYRTYYLAQSLGLTGWVTKLDDGRVEMELQGKEEDMNQLFRRLEQNSFIDITDCTVKQIPLKKENSFHVRG